MKWHSVAPKPSGPIQTVRGRATATDLVRGVMDERWEGVLIVTVLATRTWSGIHLVQIVTGRDFLLETDDRRSFVVRPADLFMRWGWSSEHSMFAWSTLEPVPRLLSESAREKIANTPLRPPAALRFRELSFPSGSQLEVRGSVHEEPAPFRMPGSGFRDQAAVPTFTGGRVEVRYLPPRLERRSHAGVPAQSPQTHRRQSGNRTT